MEISDLLILTNVLSALATLSLAFFAYKTIKASRGQLEYLKKQTKLFTIQQEPLIIIENKNFKDNKLILDLKNEGGGIAYEVAVKTSFYITKQELDEESKRKLMTTQFTDIHKLQLKAHDKLKHEQILYVKKDFLNLDEDESHFFKPMSWFNTRKIQKRDYHVTYPSGVVNFLLDESGDTILKADGKKLTFETTPMFFFTLSKYEKFEFLSPGKANTLEEILEIIKQNKIDTFGITFDLVSRDRAGRVIYHEKIDSCIFDLRIHKTIEDAINDGRKVYFTALGWREIQKNLRWMPQSHYEELTFGKD